MYTDAELKRLNRSMRSNTHHFKNIDYVFHIPPTHTMYLFVNILFDITQYSSPIRFSFTDAISHADQICCSNREYWNAVRREMTKVITPAELHQGGNLK